MRAYCWMSFCSSGAMPEGGGTGVAGVSSGPLLGGTLAFGIFLFIQGKEAAEDGAGVRIGQIAPGSSPRKRTAQDLLEMAVAGGHFKANAFQAEGAVAAALGALDFGGKGQLQCGAVRTGPAHVAVVEKALEGSRSQFGVLDLRLYSSSTQARVTSLSWARVRSATPSSMGKSRPSIWPQKASCLPF